jgi:hypothetical protein
MVDFRNAAKAQMTTRSNEQQEALQASWKRIEAHVTKLGATNNDIEYARQNFLEQIAKGFPSDACERVVMEMYKTS